MLGGASGQAVRAINVTSCHGARASGATVSMTQAINSFCPDGSSGKQVDAD